MKRKSTVLLVTVLMWLFACLPAWGAVPNHGAPPYASYAGYKLTVNGDGVAKGSTFTLAELEALKEGIFTGTYTLRTLVEPHNGLYTGISMDYLLKKAGIKPEAKSVRIVCNDGISMEFPLAQLQKADYVNEVNTAKLKPLLAFAKDGKPLVEKYGSPGYDAKAANDGGPLRLMVGQTVKGERNSPKCLQWITSMNVSTKAAGQSYSDVGKFYTWAQTSIEAVCSKGIMSPIAKDRFAPDKMMTIGVFQTSLGKAIGKTGVKFYTGKQQLTTSLTRQDMAVMTINSLGLMNQAKQKKGDGSSFRDKQKISSSAIGCVEMLESKGVLDGIAVGYFNPQKTVSRAEAAVLLDKVIALTAQK